MILTPTKEEMDRRLAKEERRQLLHLKQATCGPVVIRCWKERTKGTISIVVRM